jgi:hypothetical protein
MEGGVPQNLIFLLDRMEFGGPVRQCPTIQIYKTDGVVRRYAIFYVGNLLTTATLKCFRQREIECPVVANGSRNDSPPFF